VRRFQRPLVRRDDERRGRLAIRRRAGQQAQRLAFSGLEQAAMLRDVGFLEGVDALLALGPFAQRPVRHEAARGPVRVRPRDVENVANVVQEHTDPLHPVGQLNGDHAQFDAAHNLEVRELGDLHAVHRHLPAHARRASVGDSQLSSSKRIS